MNNDRLYEALEPIRKFAKEQIKELEKGFKVDEMIERKIKRNKIRFIWLKITGEYENELIRQRALFYLNDKESSDNLKRECEKALEVMNL